MAKYTNRLKLLCYSLKASFALLNIGKSKLIFDTFILKTTTSIYTQCTDKYPNSLDLLVRSFASLYEANLANNKIINIFYQMPDSSVQLSGLFITLQKLQLIDNLVIDYLLQLARKSKLTNTKINILHSLLRIFKQANKLSSENLRLCLSSIDYIESTVNGLSFYHHDELNQASIEQIINAKDKATDIALAEITKANAPIDINTIPKTLTKALVLHLGSEFKKNTDESTAQSKSFNELDVSEQIDKYFPH